MQVSRAQILKYTILPGILPRIYQVFASGFIHIPYFIAVIYSTAGILPRGHAYLNPANIGRYGIRHVIAEAANHLILDRKHADQIIIFTVILAGVVLLFLQLLLLAVAVMAQKPVLALVVPANILFTPSAYNPGPAQDLAFMILDQVFGVIGIFNSCISTMQPCHDLHGNNLAISGAAFPTPFHIALHTLLRFYSLGIFAIAALVVVYYVIRITTETAATGTPFGERFNETWVPVRLILCFALLTPLNIGGDVNVGLNGAQIITLWTAKFGSNMASNAWGLFNQKLTGTYLGDSAKLIGTPNAPKINDLVKFMFIVKTCQVAENYAYGHTPKGIIPYVVNGGNAIELLAGTNFDTARDFSKNGTITIRFGEQDKVNYKDYKGGVKAFCGEVQVPVSKVDAKGSPASGATSIQSMYFELVKSMWNDKDMSEYAACLRERVIQEGHAVTCTSWPDQTFISSVVSKFQKTVEDGIPKAIDQQVANNKWTSPPEIMEKGWAGAAIWYNRIAELNGDISSAVMGIPIAGTYPYIMEVVANAQRMNNHNIASSTVFDPMLANGLGPDYPRSAKDRDIAAVLNKAYVLWQAADSYADNLSEPGQGAFIDAVNLVFGTSGMFSMRRNADIHPLAQLSLLGKEMMYAAIRNFAGGHALNFGGGLAQMIDQFFGATAQVAGTFMKTMALTTIAMAFVLYYVLPFMPFIYFLFAVSGWIKAIFEAIVAMPLWALAHIRIDGEGMPGPGASNGYFLLLEIFLRPVLIVFGMLASIQIFSALVAVLNDIFNLVEANLSGFDYQAETAGIGGSLLNYARGPIDRFFFTAIYVIMCYMMALGCFKLIDEIPNTILRWFGVSVSPIVEQADGAGALMARSYEGAQLATQKVSGGQLAALLATR